MKRINRILIFIVTLTASLSLADCKHDPPVSVGSASDPDSLYTGHPYTFTDHTVQGTSARYRAIVVPASNPETYEGIQLGRMLFYDSTLSLNGKLSCASCHKQQYAFGDNQKLSANVHGSTVRNASTLVNLGINSLFFWDGRQASIEDAVNDAFTHEQSPAIINALKYLDTTKAYTYLFKKAFGRPVNNAPLVTEDKVVKALAQFIRTLRSESSKYDRATQGDGTTLTTSEANGEMVFLGQRLGDCQHCHTDGPYLTLANQDPPMRNNALDTVADVHMFTDFGYGTVTGQLFDYGKFKIPQLRNIEVSAPYMHDGRFTTLEQIADHYGTRDSLKRSPTIDPLMERFAQVYPPIPDLDAQQKSDLVAFLKTLTDTAFLHNPDFSNPFHH